MQERVKLLREYLPVGRSIFEIGSAGGRDALELQKAGFKVLASDFVQEVVDLLHEQSLDAITFDATKDEFPGGIDALYANAVFVHLNEEEIKYLLNSARKKLQNEQMIFISTIRGKGYEKTPRGRGFDRDFIITKFHNLPPF